MTTLATRLAATGEAQALREAAIVPASWNDADNSVDVIWTTGAAVTRFDWYDGEYYSETLATEVRNVRLDQLQAGGPVLLDHVPNTRALAGSIVPGSVKMERGEGKARIRLAATPDMADVVAKVRAGHLRTVSVGYMVHTYERTPGHDGERPTMHATDWEPTEISLTPVPADPGSVIRNRSEAMTQIIENDDAPRRRSLRDEDERDDNRPIYRGGQPSRRRFVTEEQIVRACSRARLSRDMERQLIEDHNAEPMTETEMYRSILHGYADHHAVPTIDNAHTFTTGSESSSLRAAFADVLYSRLSGAAITDQARQYEGASLVDMARGLLESQGERMRWARPAAVINAMSRMAGHTTSDFAHIFNIAGRRHLLDTYTSIPSPLKLLARKRDFIDFRERFAIQATGPGSLRNVREMAEYKRVTLAEGVNGARLQTYGEIFSISRQALVNDDLGVFHQMTTIWGRAAAGTEASMLAGLVQGAGIVMTEDNKPLYHADHNNIAASGSAITVASLGAAREQMRGMRNFDGETLAYVVPKYLVVGSAKETEAEQALATISATEPSGVNPFAGKLQLVVDPQIRGNSWRLFADPNIHPVLEYGNLAGEDGLFTDTRVGFDVDGVDFKCRIDIGTGAVDYRGTYMNPGN